ncbi:MAG: metal ABC transporter substrate-binding protein [Burkholderiales bacterium]
MDIRIAWALAWICFWLATPATAGLKVFACEPEWGALVRELGGDKVDVYVATNARQDPHRIEARPSLIARARSADLVVCTGAELEIGWLPLVLSQSGNARIQRGRSGYFEAARYASMREIPSSIDRAQGDVHAAGNPHIHLDPRNVEKIARALGQRMRELDEIDGGTYAARSQAFLARWLEAIARWEKLAEPLRAMPVVVHHKDLSYLLGWLGMREAGTLEPKPGLPATPAHLGDLLERIGREPVKVILRSPYSDPRPSQWLSQRTMIPAVVLPFTVGGSDRAQDLFGLFDDTLALLLAVPR